MNPLRSLVVYPLCGASFGYRIFPTSLYLHMIIYMHWVVENRDYWRNALYLFENLVILSNPLITRGLYHTN